MTDNGTLVYAGTAPLCLGYRKRPILVKEGGVIGPQSLGDVTSVGREARKKPDPE